MGKRARIDERAVYARAVCAAAICICLGCSSQPRAVEVPKYNPRAFADSLLERYDADGDGALSKQESEQAPGLLSAWARYDADGDGTIFREELEARAQRWIDRGDGMVSIVSAVQLDGRQIGNVHVKLVPDEALSSVIKPAETISRPDRASSFSIPPEMKPEEHRNLSGMQYGLYRVEVSHPQMNLAPATQSRGCDIGPSDQAIPVVIHVERQ